MSDIELYRGPVKTDPVLEMLEGSLAALQDERIPNRLIGRFTLAACWLAGADAQEVPRINERHRLVLIGVGVAGIGLLQLVGALLICSMLGLMGSAVGVGLSILLSTSAVVFLAAIDRASASAVVPALDHRARTELAAYRAPADGDVDYAALRKVLQRALYSGARPRMRPVSPWRVVLGLLIALIFTAGTLDVVYRDHGVRKQPASPRSQIDRGDAAISTLGDRRVVLDHELATRKDEIAALNSNISTTRTTLLRAFSGQRKRVGNVASCVARSVCATERERLARQRSELRTLNAVQEQAQGDRDAFTLAIASVRRAAPSSDTTATPTHNRASVEDVLKYVAQDLGRLAVALLIFGMYAVPDMGFLLWRHRQPGFDALRSSQRSRLAELISARREMLSFRDSAS